MFKKEDKVIKERYKVDWNTYSDKWNEQYGDTYSHLGDEWNDDGTRDRKRDSFYFSAYVDRFIRPDMTVLEVGPGGAKWTVRIAPKVKRLIVLDVSEEMLKRTKSRCESQRIDNVEYILSDGRDFRPISDESIDFFFSYDVFVHIALEDTWPYAQEIARILAPGAQGVCHHAINSVPEAWDRIEQNNDWYRFGRHTLGQYYYYSPETLRRMYERCGLRIAEGHEEGWNFVCVFEKPIGSIVAKLEILLKRLMGEEANDDAVRASIIGDLQSLPAQLEQSLGAILLRARDEKDFYRRVHFGAEIRRLWRGL
jgi:ubiquinone/menaquinone biosynthesis C-methylase UbiE